MIQTTSLRTVLPEIERDLAQAQQFLEFLQTSRADEHYDHLHLLINQCVGALKMATLDDAAMLLDALNDAANKLNASDEDWDQATVDALAYPLFLVPRYCQWVVEQGLRNGPILLDAINQLRRYSGDTALVESELLNIQIDTSINPMRNLKHEPSNNLREHLEKLLPLFNKARRAIKKQPSAALDLLDKVVTRLQYLCGNAPFAELFWLLCAIVQAMKDGDLRLTKQRKQWLLLCERYLMTLYNNPESTLKKPIGLSLKRELLSLIALAHSPRPLATKLCKLYDLPVIAFSDLDIALGAEQMHQPGSELYHALARSICGLIEHSSSELLGLLQAQQPIQPTLQTLASHMLAIRAAVELCELPRTMDIVKRCCHDIELLLQSPHDELLLQRLMEGLICLPERFNVMADQSLNAAQKSYWTEVDDHELMPQRRYLSSKKTVYANALKQLNDIMLQLDIAYETDNGNMVEPLLGSLLQIKAAATMIGEDPLAEGAQAIFDMLEPCTILLEKQDIENAAWPLVSLHQSIASQVQGKW